MTSNEDVLQRVWRALHEATTHRTGFTLGFLGTTGVHGGPRVRAIILRRFEQSPERIYFASHIDSDKVAEIRENPQVALTLHDNDRSVQLRIEGTANVIEDDAERRRVWEQLADHSQQLYASKLTPGVPLHDVVNNVPVEVGPSSAFERFAWIRIDLARLDWLDLSAEPHQRWQFTQVTGSWGGQRIIP